MLIDVSDEDLAIRFLYVGVSGPATVSCKNNRIMKMKVVSKTINVQAKAEYNHDVHHRFQSVSTQYAMYRSKPKRITQNPNRLVAKTQTSNTVLPCIFGTHKNVASNPQRRTCPPETLQDLQRRTIPPETLHFRRKTILPKKLQRKTIPPGTPQGRLF